MIIKNTGIPPSFFSEIPEKAAAGRSENAPGGAKAGRAGRTDRIELSPRPEQPSALLDAVKAKIGGEIRRDADAGRLRELKEAVDGGRYNVDSGALAGILLFDE